MVISVPAALKQRVLAVLKECEEKYHEHFQPVTRLHFPEIRYNINGGFLGGSANYHNNIPLIRLNPVFLTHYTEEFLQRTVIHEYAHLCVNHERAMNGHTDRRGVVLTRTGRVRRAKRDIHGPEWIAMMHRLGAKDVSRTHSYEIPDHLVGHVGKKRFEYQCTAPGCFHKFVLGPKIHRQLQRAPASRWHKGHKGHPLQYLGDKRKTNPVASQPVKQPTAPVVTPVFHRPKPVRIGTSKADRAYALYATYRLKYDRPAMIDLFMQELAMTKAGASTYYYNCEKKYGK